MVFSVTVLPPVLGPVMTSVSNSSPSSTSMGTAVSFAKSGCRALRSTMPLSESSGSWQSSLYDSLALPKMRSSLTSSSKSEEMSSICSAQSAESSASMRSISSFSRAASSRSSLLAFTAPMGSINRVAPVEDMSCTRPGTSFLCSDFMGTTYLSERMVIMGSWRALA